MAAWTEDYKQAVDAQIEEFEDAFCVASKIPQTAVATRISKYGLPGDLNNTAHIMLDVQFRVDGDTELTPAQFRKKYAARIDQQAEHIRRSVESLLKIGGDDLVSFTVGNAEKGQSGRYRAKAHVSLLTDFDLDAWHEWRLECLDED